MMAAASVGLPASVGMRFAQAARSGLKPSVIWLSFQECTGCTESLLRTDHPGLGELLLDLISLDYHEALSAAAGHQAEEARQAAMDAHAGQFVCVVEGAIPTKDNGIYCLIGGRSAVEILRETAETAGLIISIGSCASFGGIAAAEPNPTGAVGVGKVLTDRPVVTIPGCPANPYNFLGTVLQFATFGTLPELDEKGRPLFAYGRTIHNHCPRRPHFDAGRFARAYGDEGHRLGYCLYEFGCKGPQTHANCPSQHFGEVPGAWSIGIGHPCVGCTEQHLAFRVPLHQTVEIPHPTPPEAVPPIETEPEGISPLATGVAGIVGGALIGAGVMASRTLDTKRRDLQNGGGADEPPTEKGG